MISNKENSVFRENLALFFASTVLREAKTTTETSLNLM